MTTQLNDKQNELLTELKIDPTSPDLVAEITAKIEALKNSQKTEIRTVLKLPLKLAPYKFAVLPLMKKDGLRELAFSIYTNLRKQGISCDFDDSGSIGKRYRRQDENGTPFCICVDYETMENGTVTVRNRDTMEQTRVAVANLKTFVMN